VGVNEGIGQGKQIDVIGAVYALRDVAGQLNMLLLILAHGHQMGLIEKNIRRLKAWVPVKPKGCLFLILASLVLELGHTVEPSHGRFAPQHPTKLGVSRYMGLDKEDTFLGIKATGKISCGNLKGLIFKKGRVLEDGDGVHVNDAVKAVVVLLQMYPVPQRAKIVAKGKRPSGLHARKNTFHVAPFLEISLNQLFSGLSITEMSGRGHRRAEVN